MRSRVLLVATAVLLVTGGAAAQAVSSDPDAAPAPRKRASLEPDAADASAAAPAPRRAAPPADDAAAATTAAPAAAAPVSAVADAGGSEEPQGLRPKTQLATKYEPGQKILNDEGLPLVDRYVAGSLVKSVKDSGGNTVCEMVLQGEFLGGEREGKGEHGGGGSERTMQSVVSIERTRGKARLGFLFWLAKRFCQFSFPHRPFAAPEGCCL